MKKIKILKVTKNYPDYKPEGKSYTMFAAWCDVELVDGEGRVSGKGAKVCWFSKNLSVTTGSELTVGVELEEIRQEEKTYQDKPYVQITLKAKKKDYQASASGQKFIPAKKMTETQYRSSIDKSNKIAESIIDALAIPMDKKISIEWQQLQWSYFSAILKGWERVDFDGPAEEKKPEEKTAEEVKPENPIYVDEPDPTVWPKNKEEAQRQIEDGLGRYRKTVTGDLVWQTVIPF